MSLEEYAKQEFIVAGFMNEKGEYKDPWQEQLCKGVLHLLEIFSSQRHSGTTANYTLNMFNDLARFFPLTPLTGDEREWNRVGEDLWQNNRCSRVFKRSSKKAHDIEGRVFQRPDGSHYYNAESSVDIEFPYTPKTEVVKIKSTEDLANESNFQHRKT